MKSNESFPRKHESLHDFDFIEIDTDDVVMTCLLYFLEFGLIRKLKKTLISRKVLLLASDWQSFNYYLFESLDHVFWIWMLRRRRRERKEKKNEEGFFYVR